MNLFNRKTLQRFIKPAPLLPAHLALLESWADMIGSGRVYGLKEVALHGEFTAKIIQGVLGYHGPTGGVEYTVATEQAILQGSVDLALGRFGGNAPEILAPFELKGAKTKDLDAIMPGRNKTPVQQAWEYAMNARGVKWVLVSNMIELRLYGFGEGTNAYETFQLDRLTDPDEYARFMLLLSADSLLSGRTLDLLKQSRAEDRDITDRLYHEYKALRLKLVGAVQSADPTIAALDAIATAQKILDRVLFIAFAEDTGLLDRHTLAQAFVSRDLYNPRPVWDNFRGLFNAIDKGSEALKIPRYNGGLFQADSMIDSLTLPDDVCEDFKTLGGYDFASEVSVTVLGHIFEQSIADVERLQAQARGEEVEEAKASGTTGRRKRDGVVYTPDYIARFIVAETLGAHLEEAFTKILRANAKAGADLSDYAAIEWRRKTAELEAWQAYRDRLKTLRIVDPACGSGVFLIMAFDFLKAELGRVNDKIADLKGERHIQDLFDPDSEILTNNLFGVDVNSESVEIAKLSLWIKTARRGKVLDSLSSNLRVGDSLIEDSNFAYLDHAFTWADAFPHVSAEGGFDVVLGNPPYVRMEHLKALKPYLERRYEVVSDRADLYCYFFERGLRLLKPGGRLGFVSSNTFFKTGSGKPLREYLRREATIEGVVDFGDLQIFEGVTTYPAILTMKRGAAPEGHDLRFWNVDTLPETNFLATWEKAAGPYPQAALGTGSWELENPSLRALRDKLIKGRTTLKEVLGPPLMGVKTGLKPAFVIDTPTKERMCASDPQSSELIKPLIEGKDLQRWGADQRGHWLIYVPKNRIEIDDYPAIRDWLLPFKDRLEARAAKQEWFELQQAQEAYVPRFEGPKIMWSDVASEARCHLDTSGAYGENTCYFLPCDKPSVVGFLNSKLAWFVVKALTPKAQGGYARFQTQFVEQLPLLDAVAKNADLEVKAQLCHDLAEQRQTLQHALVRRIPDLCPPGRDPKRKRPA
jgi:N-6 DNA Methylase/TaqI-like C-terminal specificity domain